jgi:hypothetical protein
MEVNGERRTVVGAKMRRGDRVARFPRGLQFLTDHRPPSAAH